MMMGTAPHPSLGVAEMDSTHEEFIALVKAATQAGSAEFPALFEQLAAHTAQHFDNESRLMRECRFPAISEHESEHRRVLAEMGFVGRALARGQDRQARSYVADGLPVWFRQHLATMDSALAACLRGATLACHTTKAVAGTT
jgi:hemerythrin-like metal-binding protein